ncbi:MAG: DUF7095 family protein [Halobacteriota archaeon]
MNRSAALDRIEELLRTVETEPMAVPIREVWVYGDIALGVDPIDRLDVYVTKDILLGGDRDVARQYETRLGVNGIGQTVTAEWADRYPEYIRTTDTGHVAPEKCLAAHLLSDAEPVHLEVCNASFDDNVTQRLAGALGTESYDQILDPRGVRLWIDGRRDEDAIEHLREGTLPFPTFTDALEMLGVDEETAKVAAATVRSDREESSGSSVRGDVV